MATIKDLLPMEILDSRGNPTVACKVVLDDGTVESGYTPSGASTGKYEALELRDGDQARYNGWGVLKAVNNINTIIKPALIGQDANNQLSIDQKMIQLDGTANKAKLGANATLAVSLGVARASATSQKIELFQHIAQLLGENPTSWILPIPFLNILNGGKHAVGSTDFQEFMLVPIKFKNYSEALRAGAESYHNLGKILDERSYQPLLGDEGGFAPSLFSNEQAMELLLMAIKEAGYHSGEDIFIALDPAASRFYQNNAYQLHRENRSLTTEEMLDFYVGWAEKFPLVSIEDALSEDDWTGWQELTRRIGNSVELIGDDLYVTNKELLKKGIEHTATTGILIKPNQVGTLSETLETISMAKKAGFKIIVSHRSGETSDTFIADLAVGCGCGVLKSGAPARSERTSKYNRLLEIEKMLGDKAKYASWDAFGPQQDGDNVIKID